MFNGVNLQIWILLSCLNNCKELFISLLKRQKLMEMTVLDNLVQTKGSLDSVTGTILATCQSKFYKITL